MKGETTKENIADMVKGILEKDMNIEVKWDWYKEIEKNPFKMCQMLVEHIKTLETTENAWHRQADAHYRTIKKLSWRNDHKVYLVTLERNGERELRSVDVSMSFAVPNAKALMEHVDLNRKCNNNYEGEEVIVGIYERYENDGISMDMLRGFPLIRFVLTKKSWDIIY